MRYSTRFVAPMLGVLAACSSCSSKAPTAPTTGSLHITVTNPPGANANITVTGPSNYSQPVTGTKTLASLAPGTYTITSANVVIATDTYVPTPLGSYDVNVAVSSTPAEAAVTYSLMGQGLNLKIDGMYITQATQTYTGTVPLVKDRAGYLRVFVVANQANAAMPLVRVRWYSSGVLIRTDTINPPGLGVPTAPDESVLSSSWNLAVPASLIQPNLTALADVDPGNVIAEALEADNSFPATGIPLALNVQTAAIAKVTLVPVKTSDNRTGNVTAGNLNSFLTYMMKVHPLPGYTATLHAVYTTTAGPLQNSDQNGAWSTILNELSALHATDAAAASEHYYGVVDPPYTSGVAGLGFIGGPEAMGWDRGLNDQILAHEIGHNWGRYHSPCGNPANVDQNYPYAGAIIGVYGLDVATTTLKAPATNYDIMSYCTPFWISDYTYAGVLNYRATSPIVLAAAASTAPEPVLLVWGHLRGNEMVLEPAFEITARAQLPDSPGAYQLEGLDVNGSALFSFPFAGQEMADEPVPSRGFVFAIPLARFDIARLAALRVVAGGREVRLRGGVAAAALRLGATPAAPMTARAVGAGRAQLTWDAARFPMAMIRDAKTGQVLSFARGGRVELPVPGAELEIVQSDGVRSVRQRVRVQ